MNRKLYLWIALPILALTSCTKNEAEDTDVQQLKKEVLANISANVCLAGYEDMLASAQALQNTVNDLQANKTDQHLEQARTNWKKIRESWERSESWLFGPVSTNSIDPRIDTWPVDFNALDSILATSNVLDEDYVDGLEDALKGFHPIEYLLWGENSNKTAAQLTSRELEYLQGLVQNLVNLCEELRNAWTAGYSDELSLAGQGSAAYSTLQSAYLELADAMAGICDEVANGKIKDPFELQDPSQEESPFAKNSLTDFINNIRGVMDVYQGKFNADGKGIEDLVRSYNLSLDNEIKNAHAAAMASLQGISQPFGEAIMSQPAQLQNAMNKINTLATVLEEKLRPFLLQYAQ
jgi:uncharacterized iron-regulated protein